MVVVAASASVLAKRLSAPRAGQRPLAAPRACRRQYRARRETPLTYSTQKTEIHEKIQVIYKTGLLPFKKASKGPSMDFRVHILDLSAQL